MSADDYECEFPTDDEPIGKGARLRVFFNWDWYLSVIPEGDQHNWHAVRLCTSGGRNPAVTGTIALLHAVIHGTDKRRIRSLADSVVSLADADAEPRTPVEQTLREHIDQLERYAKRLRAALRDEIRQPCEACGILMAECGGCGARRERIEAILRPEPAAQ